MKRNGMTARELFYKTLEFDRPERIPRDMNYLPWAEKHYPAELAVLLERFPGDRVSCPKLTKIPPRTIGNAYELGAYVDEWGCEFVNKQAGIIGEVKRPLVDRWEKLSEVREPEELLTIDAEQINAFCAGTDKFVLAGSFARPFERLQFLRGTENVMMDLASGSEELRELLGKVHGFYCKELSLWAQTKVDSLYFMDDWGAQQALLISPATWRKMFKPLYQEYVDIAHGQGKKIFMHSDGYIEAIMGDVIELGVDALNCQIFCMGPEKLGAKYKGQITFWGELDRQYLLPYGSREEIAEAVQRVYRSFYQEGGVIGQLEFGPGARPENVYEALQSWEAIDVGRKT